MRSKPALRQILVSAASKAPRPGLLRVMGLFANGASNFVRSASIVMVSVMTADFLVTFEFAFSISGMELFDPSSSSFISKQWHSCGTESLDEHFDGVDLSSGADSFPYQKQIAELLSKRHGGAFSCILK